MLFGQCYVVYLDVYFGYFEAGQVLDAFDHALAYSLGQLRDGVAVVHVHGDVRRRLAFSDVHGETAGTAAAARDVVHELPDGGRGVARQPDATVGHRDAIHLFGRHPDDGRHDRILNSGGPEIAVKRTLTRALSVAHLLFSFPRNPHNT